MSSMPIAPENELRLSERLKTKIIQSIDAAGVD